MDHRGGLVAADAASEGVQVGQVVEVGSGEPLGQALVVAAGHHLGSRGDVAGGGVQLRAPGLDPVELGCPLGRRGGRGGCSYRLANLIARATSAGSGEVCGQGRY